MAEFDYNKWDFRNRKTTTREQRGLKRITLDINEKMYVDFMLRLSYDNLKRREFLENIIKLYLLKDEDVLKFVEKIKDLRAKWKRESLRVKQLRNKLARKEKEIKKDFNLDKEDISDIFDILEKDFENL